MTGKKIYRLTNIELYDAITSGTDQFSVEELNLELDSRRLTLQQLVKIEADYRTYKAIQQKRIDQPLSPQEYLICFVFPFFTPRPRWRDDHLSLSESERYKKYGFSKKLEQSVKAKRLGMLFWFLLITVFSLMYSFFNN